MRGSGSAKNKLQKKSKKYFNHKKNHFVFPKECKKIKKYRNSRAMPGGNRSKKLKRKKGGSPLSKIINSYAKAKLNLNSFNHFPSSKNLNISFKNVLPKLIGGRKKKSRRKIGGSDWKSSVYSYSLADVSDKHFKKFTKQGKKYKHGVHKKKHPFHNGPIFKPFN